MIEATRNYEQKGRGVERRGADFLLSGIPSWIGAGSVIQPCLSEIKVACFWYTINTLFLKSLFPNKKCWRRGELNERPN